MNDWIFQGNGSQLDLDAAITKSRQLAWRTPRYRDRTAAGDRVWLQVTGRHDPGIYYVATITTATYEDPDWDDREASSARWRTRIRFDYRIDPPILRSELLADAGLGAFRPFRGFQGSTFPMPADIAARLRERADARLDPL